MLSLPDVHVRVHRGGEDCAALYQYPVFNTVDGYPGKSDVQDRDPQSKTMRQQILNPGIHKLWGRESIVFMGRLAQCICWFM